MFVYCILLYLTKTITMSLTEHEFFTYFKENPYAENNDKYYVEINTFINIFKKDVCKIERFIYDVYKNFDFKTARSVFIALYNNQIFSENEDCGFDTMCGEIFYSDTHENIYHILDHKFGISAKIPNTKREKKRIKIQKRIYKKEAKRIKYYQKINKQ